MKRETCDVGAGGYFKHELGPSLSSHTPGLALPPGGEYYWSKVERQAMAMDVRDGRTRATALRIGVFARATTAHVFTALYHAHAVCGLP